MTRADARDSQATGYEQAERRSSRERAEGSGGARGEEDGDEEGVDEEEEDAEEEEEEGETRCVCGELYPPDASGLYIQCEECAVWQHGYCVGIEEGVNTPDKYWCEQCKPELHSVYSNEAGKGRSNYKPTQQRRRQQRRGKRGGERGAERGEGSAGGALQQHGEREEEEEEDEEGEDDGMRVRGRRGAASADEALGHGNEKEEKRLLSRKRATLSAREEKHYQLMLEKAIQESRRTSQPEENLKVEEKDLTNDELSNLEASPAAATTAATSLGTIILEPSTKEEQHGRLLEEHEEGGQNGQGFSSNRGSSISRKRTRGKSAASNSSSEEDLQRKRSRRGAPRKAANGSAQNSPAGSGGQAAASEISISKPIKPRLPTKKASLGEMRRRITAIMEFLSRTQLEVSENEVAKEQLIQFVENEEFIIKINSIFKDYDQALKMMDTLTRKLLLWEQKYATGGTMK